MALSDLLLQQASSGVDYSPLVQAQQQAAGVQSQAALGAGNIGANYLNQAIGSIQEGNIASQEVTSPYVQAGQGALGQAMDLTGNSGKPYEQVLSNFQTTPGYQFALKEAIGALDRSAASRGKLYSGQQVKAVQDRSAQLANQQYQQQINNQLALMQQSSPFGLQQATQQYAAGRDVGAVQSQIGDALGNAQLASGAAQAGGLLGAAEAQVAQSAVPNITAPSGLDAPAVFTGGVQPSSFPSMHQPSGGGSSGGGAAGGGLSTLGQDAGIGGTSPSSSISGAGGEVGVNAPIPGMGTPTTAPGGAGTGEIFDAEGNQISIDAQGNITNTPQTFTQEEEMANQQQQSGSLDSIMQQGGDVKEGVSEFLEQGGNFEGAMSGYSSLHDSYQQLVQQYQQAPINSSEKVSLDSQVTEMGARMNQLQFELLQSGLWR